MVQMSSPFRILGDIWMGAGIEGNAFAPNFNSSFLQFPLIIFSHAFAAVVGWGRRVEEEWRGPAGAVPGVRLLRERRHLGPQRLRLPRPHRPSSPIARGRGCDPTYQNVHWTVVHHQHARGHCSALKKPPRHFPLEGSSCPPLGQRSGLFSSLTAKRELSPRRIPGKGGTVPPSGHEGVTEIGDAPRGSRRHITASNHIPFFLHSALT